MFNLSQKSNSESRKINGAEFPLSILTAILLSKVLGSIYGPIFYFVFITLITSLFLESKHKVFQLSISSVLFFGLSPIYLIGRGYFTDAELSKWDLQIYGLIFLATVIFFRFGFRVNSFNQDIKSKIYSSRKFLGSYGALILGVTLFILLKQKSLGNAVAWALSGDSKNHLVNAVSIIDYGFLNPSSFLVQPSSSPSFLAIIMAQADTQSMNLTDALQVQLQSYASVWILLIGIAGISFSAALEFLWRNLIFNPVEPTNSVLALASLIPTFSFALGPALYDGFFTAYFAICATITLVIWFLESRFLKVFSWAWIALGFVIFACTIFGWMFVFPFTSLIFAIGVFSNFQKNLIFKRHRILFIFLPLGAAYFSIKHLTFIQDLIYKSKIALGTVGAINATGTNYFLMAIIFILILGLQISVKNKSFGNAIFLLGFVEIIALIGFKNYSNLNLFDWNYYLLKYQWVMFVSLMAVLVCLLIVLTARVEAASRFKVNFSIALFLLLTYLASESTLHPNNIWQTNKVWQRIWDGWSNPTAQTVNLFLEHNIDPKNPTMFFHYGYGGEDMLANFWLTAFSDPIEPIKGWNYTIDTTGDVQQICDVNAYYPKVTVVTSDLQLEELAKKTCPTEEFNFILKPSPI